MISPIPNSTPTIPTYATLPLPGVQLALLDENGQELDGNQVSGKLCIKFPWPSIARTIWGDHQRYKDTYFSAFKNKYFTGDGALRNSVGYYSSVGRWGTTLFCLCRGSSFPFLLLTVSAHLH